MDYSYDEGTTRTIKNDGTTQTIYVNKYYEEEDDGTSNTVRSFIYSGDLKIAKIEGSVTTFNHLDHLSGSNVSTDDTGAVIELNDYYPYGDSRIEDRVGGYENDYMYTGKEHDEETDLYYYGARYYDAKIGRFVSVDPWAGDITDPQSFNKYSYARNNPLKYVDPTGMAPYDFFESKDDAAKDFGNTYNDNSIKNNKEYASSIIKVVNKEGNSGFTYTIPFEGGIDWSIHSEPMGLFPKVGLIHTHGAYDPMYDNNIFSTKDKNLYNLLGLTGYVVTPNGSLFTYDPKTGQLGPPISTGMPSDPNDPTRENSINPISLPSDEPAEGILDYITTGVYNIFKRDEKSSDNQSSNEISHDESKKKPSNSPSN